MLNVARTRWDKNFLKKSGADGVIRQELARIAAGIEEDAARASRWDSDSGLTDPRQSAGYRAELGKGMAAVVTVLNATPNRQRRLLAAAKKRGGKK